jgi:hypothetical protein
LQVGLDRRKFTASFRRTPESISHPLAPRPKKMDSPVRGNDIALFGTLQTTVQIIATSPVSADNSAVA